MAYSATDKNPFEAMFKEYPDVLSIEDLCKMFGVGKVTAYRLIREGKIRCMWIGKGYKIPKVCVIDFLKKSGLPCSDGTEEVNNPGSNVIYIFGRTK